MESKIAGLIKGNTVIVCIGNSLRGDDGFGPLLASLLAETVSETVLDVGEVPESYTEKVALLAPQTVLLVDAVNFGGKPGDWTVLERSQLSNNGMFSHQLPLAIFMDYLQDRTGAKVFLLGVQPAATHFGSVISPEVRKTAEYLSEWLQRMLKESREDLDRNEGRSLESFRS